MPFHSPPSPIVEMPDRPGAPEPDDRVRQTAIDILSYLRRNPGAKDSVVGIAQWWVNEDVKVVERALDLLLGENVIEKNGSIFQLHIHR